MATNSYGPNNFQPATLKGLRKLPVEAAGVPSSIYVIKKYGVPLSYMRFAVANIWNIREAHAFTSKLLPDVTPEEVVHSHLVRWDTSYALKQASKGYITRDGIDYVVMYHGATRRAMAQYSKVLLSFRYAATGYDVLPTVLIKPYYQTPADAAGWTDEIGEAP